MYEMHTRTTDMYKYQKEIFCLVVVGACCCVRIKLTWLYLEVHCFNDLQVCALPPPPPSSPPPSFRLLPSPSSLPGTNTEEYGSSFFPPQQFKFRRSATKYIMLAHRFTKEKMMVRTIHHHAPCTRSPKMLGP